MTETNENSKASGETTEGNDEPSETPVTGGEKASESVAEKNTVKPKEDVEPTESDDKEIEEKENVGEKRPSPSSMPEEEAPAKTQKVDPSIEVTSEQAVVAQQ